MGANGLTDRRLEVSQLICDGLSSHAIATKLGLSVNTIAVHRANIMRTLGIRGAAELVAHAIRHGLVSLSQSD
jgi:DNA-binding NarL/FixJ family response regulator